MSEGSLPWLPTASRAGSPLDIILQENVTEMAIVASQYQIRINFENNSLGSKMIWGRSVFRDADSARAYKVIRSRPY